MAGLNFDQVDLGTKTGAQLPGLGRCSFSRCRLWLRNRFQCRDEIPRIESGLLKSAPQSKLALAKRNIVPIRALSASVRVPMRLVELRATWIPDGFQQAATDSRWIPAGSRWIPVGSNGLQMVSRWIPMDSKWIPNCAQWIPAGSDGAPSCPMDSRWIPMERVPMVSKQFPLDSRWFPMDSNGFQWIPGDSR